MIQENFMSTYDLIILGAGASGLFAAINVKELQPTVSILILEKGLNPLAKLLKTGGGRCNLTNATFDIKEFASHYPRGAKELLGPLSRFGPRELMTWFEDHQVILKIENEAKVFPQSNKASEIADTLLDAAMRQKVDLLCNQTVCDLSFHNSLFHLELADSRKVSASHLMLATACSEGGLNLTKKMGHTIISPAPSLFAFSIEKCPYTSLSGLSIDCVTCSLQDFPFHSKGPLLFTHSGVSGPSILKLSSHAARYLYEKKYRATLWIDWLSDTSHDEIIEMLKKEKAHNPALQLSTYNPFHLPRPFWKAFCQTLELHKCMCDLSSKELVKIADKLKRDTLLVTNRAQNREEFVSAGGVLLSEVDFKTMESKCTKNLYFAGEILNIDGETGGFNLQNAWTTAFIAACAIASRASC